MARPTSWRPRNRTGPAATSSAGGFDYVGGVARNYIAHIRADGSLDPDWEASVNYIVRDLKLSGDTLYVAGDFTAIDGQPRAGLGALDASTGT